jgi:alkanesulfonate monooxygenase SsuD/methylene tetrahydromethanopterin reductase-like flavin-dependent oxidoreductase (luciferase family)
MRVGLVILPSDRWTDARRQWEWADAAGFCTAWTYDHIRWGGMPDGPWHAAVPVLAAAAGVTNRIRLGTLVATPNFRHPVTLARDALALDDLSDGRFDLGLGPGSEGPDARAFGQEPWSPAERLAHFGEFLEILQPIVSGEPATRTTLRTAHYAAYEAPSTPGAVQRPFPLTIAAGGAKGMRLAATYGSQWVTVGPTAAPERTLATILDSARTQRALLDAACMEVGRHPSSIGKVLLWIPTEPIIESPAQFDELAGPYAELGFDQFVLHHPAQTGPYGGQLKTFEEIAARYASG